MCKIWLDFFWRCYFFINFTAKAQRFFAKYAKKNTSNSKLCVLCVTSLRSLRFIFLTFCTAPERVWMPFLPRAAPAACTGLSIFNAFGVTRLRLFSPPVRNVLSLLSPAGGGQRGWNIFIAVELVCFTLNLKP